MLPKISAFRKYFDETNVFFIKDNELLKKLMKFEIKSTKLFKKDLIVSLYRMKIIYKIVKINSKTNTNFHNDKMPLVF